MKQWSKILVWLLAAGLTLGLCAAGASPAEHATARLAVTIAVSGAAPVPADEVGIRLEALDAGAPMPEGAKNGVWQSGTVQNTGEIPIVIDYDNVGVYHYKVTQTHPDNPSMSYQTTEYELRITVYREKGELLVAQYFHEGNTKDGSITYTNTRKTAKLTVSKAVQVPKGLFIFGGKKFQMTLVLSEAAVVPAGYQWPEGVTTQDAKTFTFELAHDKSVTLQDLPVGASYTVTEAPEAGYNPRQEGEPLVVSGVIAEDSSAAASFINEYHTAPSEITLRAEKVLTGRDWQAGEEYGFTLTPVDGAPVGDGTQATVSKNGAFSFDLIKYTQADMAGATQNEDGLFEKVFTYTITEDLPDGVTQEQPEKAGVTYDTHTLTVHVTVTDDGEGNLSAQAVYDGATTFTNAYHAQKEVTLEGEKILSGRAFKPGDQWTFTLAAESSDSPMPDPAAVTITPAEGESIQFAIGPITFDETQLGEHRYTLTESGQVAAVTNAVRSTITVTVTDNGNGTLTAEVAYANNGTNEKARASFINYYESKGDGTPAATKVLTGRDLAAEQFSFELVGADGRVLETAKNAADGTVTFSTITYTQADVPKSPFKYTVREVVPATAAPGYTYDTHSEEITVTLTDNGKGQISAEVSPAGSKVVFTNIYQGTGKTVDAEGESTLRVSKTLEGASLTEGQFSFELKDQDGNVLQTAQNAADGSVVFEPLEYTEKDVKNSPFTYYITEAAGNNPAMTYDKHSVTVTVTVTDNGDGTLNAIPSYEGETTFVNVYASDGSAIPAAVKVLTGRDLAAEQFSFELVGADGQVLETVKNAADGTVTFSPIKYTQADMPKSPIKYTIREAVPATAAPGYTYDTHTEEITVTLTDDGEGGITASVSPAGAEIVFTNIYKGTGKTVDAEGKSTLRVAKTLEGMDLKAGQFSFELRDAAGELIERVTNAADGSVVFTPLEYTEKDLKNSPFTYTVTEVKGDNPGMTYDEHTVTITVTVTDNGDGTLNAIPTYKGETTFKNVYKGTGRTVDAEGKSTLRVAKTLEGMDLKAGQFSFELRDASGELIERVTNAADGSVVFTPLEYTEKDVKQSKFTYTVTEVKGDNPGMTYDSHTVTVKVTVTDNGDGTLNAIPTYEGETTFKNVYKGTGRTVDAEGQSTLRVAKTLEGMDLKAGQFSFELRDAAGELIERVTNDTEGNVVFTPLEYTEKDVKQSPFTYTVTEVKGDNPGMTYDSHTVTVKVTVTDNGDGTLNAIPAYEGETTFKNIYKGTGKTVDAEGESTLRVSKTLEGMDLKAGQFSFELRDAAGELIERVTNAADGSVVFTPLEYTEKDLKNSPFTYTVTEVKGDNPGMTYDSHSVTVKVTVTDNGDGTLNAIPAYEGETTFKNIYKGTGRTVDAEGQSTLRVAKTLEGMDLKAGQFSFELRDASGELIERVTNAADGSVVFTPLEYTEKDLKNSPFTYTVNEVKGDNPAMTYDSHTVTVKVTVTDNGDGTLNAIPTYEGETTFKNVYKGTGKTVDAEGQSTLRVAKTLEGMDLKAGQFSFELRDASGELIERVTNDAEGNVVFTPLEYTEKDLKNSPFTYTVTEVKGDSPGMTYDSHTVTVKVTVTDNGDGTLNAIPAYEGETTFKNIYKATGRTVNAAGESTLRVVKRLEGAELTAGQFTFELKDKDGNVLRRARNAADGSVVFEPLEYTEQDVKNSPFTYYVTEVEGDDPAMTYDKHRVTVTVTVTDNGDGTLTAAPAYSGGPTFVNTYEAPIYTLTVYYQYLDTRATAAPTVVEQHPEGEGYSITSPVIVGYVSTRARVYGTMPGHDVVEYVYYIPATIIIDEPDTPLGLGEIYINVGDCLE